ncbi:hypothetical protein FRC02_008567 [Tulasnella sp. 418]|nr:hypothetical protein FRC02_008567 [Tulasnella sp. 418]
MSWNYRAQQQQQQQQQPASIFGTTQGAQTQPQQSTFGGFGQTGQQQGPSGFGGLGQSQRPAGTGLFGGATNPGLFGNPANAITTAPATSQAPSTGLFGSTTQPAAPSTGLFGQTNQPTGQTASGGTGFFGQNQAQQPTQQATGGLFGAPSNTAQPAMGGFYGAGPTNPTQQATTNMFGATTTNAPASNQQTLGTSLFGPPKPAAPMPGMVAAPQQPLGPSGPGGPTDPAITKSTKFNDLPQPYKQILENVDAAIQRQIQISRELKTISLGVEPEKGAKLAKQVAKTAMMTANTISSDEAFIQDLSFKLDQSVQDSVMATRILDGFGNPQQNGSYLKTYAEFPLEYFTRLATQLRERLERYKLIVEQIERKLASAAEGDHTTPQGMLLYVQCD